ncbi:cbb3-type cytochrome c oxidase subunit 3 [Aurantiacibacter sp. MUD11]|uniref:cbb3-type cytochrome c oxidase subunit 3 n=1 Tax=Aurantiacibacter sp. MUD11 TaxID=3003265 RepID=UPI0022AA6666|nr:cbb3-type cytochrome c oxidase subunit 3 [Aurantiacibacter sp. MUD11]WAT18178.1 cbb3-type cytochrome c oxidase subunit 3 [Aurantiacibacter sp. MUD11]
MTDHSTYEFLRQLADSWGLLAMVLLWLGFALWAFRPSARSHHEDAANMIFKDENDG